MEQKKLISIICCVILILISSTICVLNKDKLFTNKIVVTYPDGCKEIYYNNILNNSICEYGRELEEQRKTNTTNPWLTKNLTI